MLETFKNLNTFPAHKHTFVLFVLGEGEKRRVDERERRGDKREERRGERREDEI